MLKKIAKRINKEIEQAEDYCEQAMLIKHEAASTADLFTQLSAEEITHAKKLLREGQRLIDDKQLKSYDKDEHSEYDTAHYEKCKVIWEWEHRLATERIAEIEYKLSMYRSM